MIPNNRHRRRPPRFILFPVLGAALALLLGVIVMLLWNAILPSLLHVSRISFWQAVGLLILCRILFGNFGKGGGHHRHPASRKMTALRDKWMHMSPEERERFRDEWRQQCRHRGMKKD